jgi:hypothetical protein
MRISDAIDELVERSKSHGEMLAFHQFHQAHPEVLDFLVEEIRLRLDNGFQAFAFRSLWEYARWKLEMKSGPSETYLMNDHLVAFYSRAIIILHPEFNGLAELRESKVDDLFGTRLEPLTEKRPKKYSRRLQWADGTTIENGWRPTFPHAINHAANRKRDIHAKGE